MSQNPTAADVAQLLKAMQATPPATRMT